MPGSPTVIDATARPVRPRPPADPAWAEVRGPLWHVVRWGVALGWLGVVVALALAGDRTSSTDALLSAAAAGKVSEVQVSGRGFDPAMRGYVVEQVRWREGPLRYTAEIVEAHPRRAGLRAQRRGEVDQRLAVTTDAAAYLTDHTDGVSVTNGPRTYPDAEIGPWHVPSWVATGVLVLGAATLFLLVGGPRPWRATRWAWFWLMCGAAPIGVPAYLLLSGPVPWLPGPRPGARLLTGGWAFLLTFFLLKRLTGG